MSRLFSWLLKTNNIPTTPVYRQLYFENLINDKRLKELTTCLQRKSDQMDCINGYFHLLSKLTDDAYMDEIFELIITKSRLPPTQIARIVVDRLSQAISSKDFGLFERILRLSHSSIQLPLSTYDVSRLISTCSDSDQIARCLSILIEKNLRFEPEYPTWILILLIEHYKTGGEIVIENFLREQTNAQFLYVPYGDCRVTPLMIFLHLYSNPKCQAIIDQQLSNIQDPSVLLQYDRWNRSYLMHLICNECQHVVNTVSTTLLSNDLTEINDELIKQCPYASAIFSQFVRLYELGNKFETPVKTIFNSRLCFPLRIKLFNYIWENNTIDQIKLDDFFVNFPSMFFSSYQYYLKRLVHNQNLDQALTSVVLNCKDHPQRVDAKITFLLRQGARINDMNVVSSTILSLLNGVQSSTPFMLLDYDMPIKIDFQLLSRTSTRNMALYIFRAAQCGYTDVSQSQFESFKSTQSKSMISMIDKLVDIKSPTTLSNLCRRKLRRSLKNLGDDTMDKLNEILPHRLVHSIRLYEYHKWLTCYHNAP
ncbi:unnamed protein product [Adineta ricciae]|uniref:SOCS box domain-containing protein n=1 Tax=Adineta ricciae TaxID=249248 RepID=A0A814IV26_ADIRI|nr:unnamed protein product [Adineta ricciae]CAF1029953.1 unnamed protein product [Adineta ricciae]